MTTTFEENYQIWANSIPEADRYYKQINQSSSHYTHHSEAELSEWIVNQELHKGNIIIIYGLEDGTIYNLIKPWLRLNPRYIAVFAEDNPLHFKQFLENPASSEILKDEQCWVLYGNTAENIGSFFIPLFKTYPFYEPLFLQLPKRNPETAKQIIGLGKIVWLTQRDLAHEFETGSLGFTANLYENIYLLPESKNFAELQNSFEKVPAIIVGAGPSLERNRHLLNEYKNKALIIAGGTSINALNAGNVQPHFGIGIDPNHQFYNRILSNTAWEVPFLYYYRMNHKALSLVLGDKMFVRFNPFVSIDRWIHSKLGVNFSTPFNRATKNVIHIATLTALYMGCDPIIFVGIDLAYTGDSSYAPGIKGIAAQTTGKELRSKHPTEQIIIRKDIYDQPIKTLWKWVQESIWYGEFCKDYPNTQFINCTEGGLGFRNVPNAPLSVTAEKYFSKDYGDLDQVVKKAYQRTSWCTLANADDISAVLKEFDESLERCENMIQEELPKLSENDNWEKPQLPFLDRISSEPAYMHLLKPIDNYLLHANILKFQRLDGLKDFIPKERSTLVKMDAHKKRCFMFLGVIRENRKEIQKNISAPHLPSLFPLKVPPPQNEWDGTTLKTYYPNGVLKSVIPKHDNLFNGEILLYYHNGALSRRLHYNNGKKHGSEEIWARNGQLLVQSEYVNDVPVGTAREWHMNGVLARETMYDDTGQVTATQSWDNEGKICVEKRNETDTFLANVQTQIQLLSLSLHTVIQKLKSIGVTNLDLEKEIHEHIERLKNLERKVQPEEVAHSKDTNEPLWMTPISTNDIQWEITELNKKVLNTTDKVGKWIKKIVPEDE